MRRPQPHRLFRSNRRRPRAPAQTSASHLPTTVSRSLAALKTTSSPPPPPTAVVVTPCHAAAATSGDPRDLSAEALLKLSDDDRQRLQQQQAYVSSSDELGGNVGSSSSAAAYAAVLAGWSEAGAVRSGPLEVRLSRPRAHPARHGGQGYILARQAQAGGGDPVNYDPQHAALPWADLRILVEVATFFVLLHNMTCMNHAVVPYEAKVGTGLTALGMYFRAGG
jgi:hypothetical protein